MCVCVCVCVRVCVCAHVCAYVRIRSVCLFCCYRYQFFYWHPFA